MEPNETYIYKTNEPDSVIHKATLSPAQNSLALLFRPRVLEGRIKNDIALGNLVKSFEKLAKSDPDHWEFDRNMGFLQLALNMPLRSALENLGGLLKEGQLDAMLAELTPANSSMVPFRQGGIPVHHKIRPRTFLISSLSLKTIQNELVWEIAIRRDSLRGKGYPEITEEQYHTFLSNIFRGGPGINETEINNRSNKIIVSMPKDASDPLKVVRRLEELEYCPPGTTDEMGQKAFPLSIPRYKEVNSMRDSPILELDEYSVKITTPQCLAVKIEYKGDIKRLTISILDPNEQGIDSEEFANNMAKLIKKSGIALKNVSIGAPFVSPSIGKRVRNITVIHTDTRVPADKVSHIEYKNKQKHLFPATRILEAITHDKIPGMLTGSLCIAIVNRMSLDPITPQGPRRGGDDREARKVPSTDAPNPADGQPKHFTASSGNGFSGRTSSDEPGRGR